MVLFVRCVHHYLADFFQRQIIRIQQLLERPFVNLIPIDEILCLADVIEPGRIGAPLGTAGPHQRARTVARPTPIAAPVTRSLIAGPVAIQVHPVGGGRGIIRTTLPAHLARLFPLRTVLSLGRVVRLEEARVEAGKAGLVHIVADLAQSDDAATATTSSIAITTVVAGRATDPGAHRELIYLAGAGAPCASAIHPPVNAGRGRIAVLVVHLVQRTVRAVDVGDER